jgi:hypothetical protein
MIDSMQGYLFLASALTAPFRGRVKIYTPLHLFLAFFWHHDDQPGEEINIRPSLLKESISTSALVAVTFQR